MAEPTQRGRKGTMMGTTPRALDVAHYFLRKGQEEGIPMDCEVIRDSYGTN